MKKMKKVTLTNGVVNTTSEIFKENEDFAVLITGYRKDWTVELWCKKKEQAPGIPLILPLKSFIEYKDHAIVVAREYAEFYEI